MALRTANASGGASPTVTSTGKTGFCKFQLVGGANYTFTSATVQFGTATAKAMTQSGNIVYGYSDPDSIAQASAYTVKVTVVVKGTDGVSRTYTDSTYISKSVPAFDVSNDGNCFAFFGTAIDGLANKTLIIHGELAFDTETSAAAARANLGLTGAETKTLLWTNASPTSGFANQTVNLNLSNYDSLEIEFKTYSTSSAFHVSRHRIGVESVLTTATGGSPTLCPVMRIFNSNASGITFVDYFDWNFGKNNTVCLPTKIYGIKKV